MTDIKVDLYFSSPVYIVEKPEFLHIVNEVSNEYFDNNQNIDEVYPVKMGANYFNDERLKEFCQFIGEASWGILNEQGYEMQFFELAFSEMWTQEHYKTSSMEKHIHGNGSQIVGFYFLETPENCSELSFHDPRQNKEIIDLPAREDKNINISTKTVNFMPKPGLLVFSNAWLPHSFTRNRSDKPIKFVHFNLIAIPKNTAIIQEVEII